MPYIGNVSGFDTVDTDQIKDAAIETAQVKDDAITKEKLNLLSTSSVPALEAKGDGSSQDGYIQLNCSQNTHGIKLKSPPHSAGASYTLTFPNDDGNANQLLKTNGSGVLSWATDSSTDSTKMPLAGGAFSGAVTTNSTIDGRDVAADGVLATNAMPKAGGAFSGDVTNTSTGSFQVSQGTTAQRPAGTANGRLRYNSTEGAFEGHTAAGWGEIGGGGPSLGTNSIIRTNALTISENITIPASSNGMSAGPITIADGNTVTVNGTWSIV